MKKLLILGDTSSKEALGSKLIRGAKMSELDKEWQISVAYTSPATIYSPSMKTKRGRILYRLRDKRSIEWWEFQTHLIKIINKICPDLVLVTGILPLSSEVFHTIHAKKGQIVNYLTDDPWNKNHKRKLFIENIKYYDHIFSTKKLLQSRLESQGALSTSWLPFAYDPELHYPGKRKTDVDIIFVGTGARERLPWLSAVKNIPDVKRRIHGNSWGGLKVPGWEVCSALTGDHYRQAIYGSKIVLGLLRAANGDLSTDRSYEIGAIGGCGLYQDTEEHRELLEDYPNNGFFSCRDELEENANIILKDKSLQKQMREIGLDLLTRKKHTYAARIESILSWWNA